MKNENKKWRLLATGESKLKTLRSTRPSTMVKACHTLLLPSALASRRRPRTTMRPALLKPGGVHGAPRKSISFGSLSIRSCARSVNTSTVPHSGPPLGLSNTVIHESTQQLHEFERDRSADRIGVRMTTGGALWLYGKHAERASKL